ncbi:MAG TPA: hypothetical protein QF776_09595 [Acidimicrobiales bacterium]|jgi:hypothetical protein|nr:hypothetical protein [Acidimicrobiales bacterium]HJM28890.1 hypothetical protein [Acidimicrobiales bacterium]HJM98409.1 hypothetical protein [Acidimicrobiales bacterium]
MVKKFLWLTAGFGAGISSSIWVKRVVKRQTNKYRGSADNNFVAESIRTTKSTFDNATQEGKKIVGKYRARITTNSDQKLPKPLLIVNE